MTKKELPIILQDVADSVPASELMVARDYIEVYDKGEATEDVKRIIVMIHNEFINQSGKLLTHTCDACLLQAIDDLEKIIKYRESLWKEQ